ncbi:MAG TPA: response regulator [Pyrinomonadaceae bacterium]|jgi:signal transduction histidine kinase|nr:response regulator [Pyrinomonadaceae bacterium]
MLKVLIVDDEPSIRLTMAEFLKRDGYDVLVAADCESAALLTGDGIDVAVVDINLPGKSGIEFLRELGARDSYIPVIMITGEPNPSLLPEIVRAGAYDFIAKPVVKDALLKAVARAAEKKRLVDEKRMLEERIRLHTEELETRVSERTAELVDALGRLAHQEKIAALGRVAAQVAHEVKNPLAGLLLYSMHLKSKTTGKLSDAESSLIDKIIDTVNHLTGTVEQVLNFARPIKLMPHRADLNRIVSDVLQLLQPQLSANRIEQRLEFDDAGVVGALDETSVRAALMNLILNAVQAMPDGGTLSIATSGDAASIRLEIKDTGTGMTPEQARNVFEPFYTTKSQGLGLGMPYAKRVIEQHRGAVSVDSRPGEGTTIRIQLPTEAEG